MILYGPRQAGKTTLCKKLYEAYPGKKLYINCDNTHYRDKLSSQNIDILMDVIGDAKLVILDEAQRVKNIGINAKIIYDAYPDIQLILT